MDLLKGDYLFPDLKSELSLIEGKDGKTNVTRYGKLCKMSEMLSMDKMSSP